MDFDQLGQHDLPLIGGLCLVQWTSPAGQHDFPLIGGLCHVQRTLPAGHNMISSKIEHDKKPMTHQE